MKLAALTSGGKDSLYAVYLMRKGGHEIRYLLCMKSLRDDSYMFHHPNVSFVGLQAELMGLEVIFGETAGEKEKELADLESLILKVADDVEGVVTGAIASEYQKSRVEAICKKLGLRCFSPLWHTDPLTYWDSLLAAGFKVLVSSVAADGLGEEWLGKVIDRAALEKLKALSQKYHFHLAFEGGEAETFVLNCPMFSGEVKIKSTEKKWDGQRGTYVIKEAVL
jgi:ABC transporter with metal-binding/Fe-S-binding domain ATP-binding protein